MKRNLPSITLCIATFNEERRIENCLRSIKKQQYPQSLIEILIVDAYSTDSTINIAKKYNCKIILNEKKLAEPGLALGYEKAKGDYMVFMAADNILFDEKWLIKMIKPFLDSEDIWVSFSKVCNDPRDNIWNKYMNEDQDPFSSFVFANASHPDKFDKLYPIYSKTKDYVVYRYDTIDFPLIALAQGTIVKTRIPRKTTIYDDIAPIIEIIRTGKNIAFVTSTCLFHYSYKGFYHLYNKLDSRIHNSLSTSSYRDRDSYSSLHRKLRKYLFLFYSVSIILPILDGIALMVKRRKWYMFLHPIVVCTIAYLLLKNYITIYLYEKN